MNRAELKEALETAEQEYQRAVAMKRELEAEFSAMKAQADERRIAHAAYAEWKRKKAQEKVEIEKIVATRKMQRKQAHDALYLCDRQSVDVVMRAERETRIAELERSLTLAKIENRDLQMRNTDLENKLITLNRQFDVAIRQWNALPPAGRAQVPA